MINVNELYIFYGILIAPAIAALAGAYKNWKLVAALTMLASTISVLLSVLLFFTSTTISNSWFYVDNVSKAMLLVISATFILAAFHAYVCMGRVKEFYLPQNYYLMFLNIFALTMFLAVSTPDIGYAWIWLESSTIASAVLILMEKGKAHIESAWRYIIIASSGLALALLSVILFGMKASSFLWAVKITGPISLLIGVLALLGFGTKAGLFPVHTWLPDAHGTAPSPVSAMLSGALLPSALIVFYRIYQSLLSPALFYATLTIGILTVLVAGTLMLSQRKLKRLLAYSSMDVMGISTVGIALTIYYPSLIEYVLLIFGVHALAKSSLFLAAGTLKRSGLDDLQSTHSLIKMSPALSFTIAFSALAVTGAPPFGMFIGELAILSKLSFNIYAFVSLLTGFVLSFLALNYWTLRIIFPNEDSRAEMEFKPRDSAVPLVGAITMLAVSFFIYSWFVWGWFP